MSVFSDIKKAFKRLGSLERDFKRFGGRLESTARDASKGVQEVGKLWSAVNGVRGDVKDAFEQIEKLPDTIEREAERVARKVYEESTEGIEELVEDAIESFASALAQQGIQEFRDLVNEAKSGLDSLRESRPALVDEIDNLSIYLELGPVTMTWEGFYTRAQQVADILDYYVDNPPTVRRKDILDFIAAVAPTSVDAGISVQAALLVVSSKELSIGAGLGEIRLALFLELGDLILDELGVPE